MKKVVPRQQPKNNKNEGHKADYNDDDDEKRLQIEQGNSQNGNTWP